MNTSAVKNYARDGAFSVITALGFCVYNAVLGFSKSYSFAICMAIYYFLLTAIRIGIAAGAIITRKNGEEGAEKTEKLCVCSSWLLIALNVALIAAIIMLVRQERNFSLGIIPAITTAAYCTYKTTAAIVRYVRKGGRSSLDARGRRDKRSYLAEHSYHGNRLGRQRRYTHAYDLHEFFHLRFYRFRFGNAACSTQKTCRKRQKIRKNSWITKIKTLCRF